MSQCRQSRECFLLAIMRFMASSGGSVMLPLVGDGKACAPFLAPDFIQAMLRQVGQRVTVGVGTPL